jgi:hypothetical protein
MKKSGASQGQPAAELISKRIAELGDWRGKTLGRMRRLIREADPAIGVVVAGQSGKESPLPDVYRGWSSRAARSGFPSSTKGGCHASHHACADHD